MEMSLGSTVFLRLDGFTPEWRQGILVFSDKRGRYQVFAVRASNSELVAREADFTSFEVDGDKHILVEGSKDKTRSQCPFPHAAIEVEYAKVLKRATEVMGQEDIQYATASEGLDEANPRRDKKSAMPSTTLDLDSGTSEDSGESGEDDVVKLLRRAGKGYVEKDMPSGSQERITKRGKRDRYPLLQKTKSQSVSTKLDVDEVMQSVLVKGNADSNPLNTLVQLELLKELRDFGSKCQQQSGIFVRERRKTEGCREGTSSLSSWETCHAAKAGKAHSSIHPRGRRSVGCFKAQQLPPHRLHSQVGVGQASDTHESAFCTVTSASDIAEGQCEPGSFGGDAVVAGGASMRPRSGRVEDGVVASGLGRPPGEASLWGGGPTTGTGSLVCSSYGRPRKEEPQQSKREGGRRDSWKGKRGRQKERKESGETRGVGDEAHLHGGVKSSGSQFCDLRALIQSQHGSFSRYVRIYERSLLETRASSPSPTAGSNPLFPSMLAWQKPPGKSRRRGHPKAVYREAFGWLKLVWMLFNYLDAGSPSSTHSIRAAVDRAAMGKWTAQHEGYARAMFVKLVRYCAHPRGTMDRGPAKLDELIRRIKISQYDPNLNLDEAVCGAKDVDPNRISLPQQAGILDPRDHLKDEKLQQFLEMPKNIPCVIPPGNGPVACHKVADEDWPTLLGKLHDAQMITFLKKQDVLKEGRRLIRGGLFCVPHKPESDRLINDRRPLNVRENRLDWCQLPAGHMLTQLLLGPSDSVRASGDDLNNYFYLIKHLEEWQHRNAFGKPFRGAILPGRGLDPKQLYLPAFRVVCMGDTNGVDLAQATHEAVLEDAGCLLKNETLVYGRVFPSSKTLEGLYIDDHLVFQVLPKEKVRDREKFRDEEITAAARRQYENLGLPRSLKKAFDKQYSFKAWGTQINSATGDASAPPEKLRQVESLAIVVLQCGVATQKAMQKLIGLFVHPFMHRRECMSIFHHIYRYIDRMGEGKKFKLPQHVKDELVTATLLLPFSGSNIRLPVSVQIAATDASSRRGGRAACLTTKAMAKTLYRFGEKRGEYTRLDWDLHAMPPHQKWKWLQDL